MRTLTLLAVAFVLSALASAPAHAKIVTEVVEYKDGDVVLEGLIAYDDAAPNVGAKGKRAGVVVVHDWMGNNAFSKKKAEDLAALGYVAIAADIYGKGVRPKSPDEARTQAGKYKGDRKLLRTRVKAAHDRLLAHPLVDAARTAAIGFCFGGTTALELARSGANVAGVVSFHGGLDAPADARAAKGAVKAKVLVLHGADDPFVKPDEIASFKDELRSAGADWQFVEYADAVHSFTNQAAGTDKAKGAAYNASADRRSWVAMRAFFDEVLAAK